jgi:[protein-PII] uridylyltransferase
MNVAAGRARRATRPAEEASAYAQELRDLVAAAGRAAGGDILGFRKAAAQALAPFLAARRAEARARLDEDGRGMACAEFLSAVQDLIVRALHEHLASAGSAPPLAVVAVGGYGRGALAPHSDIDLLFVAAEPGEARTKKIVETLLYVLWDLKQKVGHATRSVDDCIAQARGHDDPHLHP